jgi:hypothetical protein
MVHCSDVGNRLYEFLFRKSTYKSRDWQKYPKKSRFVIVGRNIFESHFLSDSCPTLTQLAAYVNVTS